MKRPKSWARRDERPVRDSSRSAASIIRSPALAPIQRSGSGSHRGERWSTHGQPRQLGAAAEHQVGERLAGQVRGADTVTDVPAAPAQPGARVESDRGEPVARDAERAAPLVRDLRISEGREQLPQHAMQLVEHVRVAVVGRLDSGAVVVGRTATTEGEPAVAPSAGRR